ncbi:integrase arm-type DNA-binding domain-containing protein [Lysobacter sp. MMG2]|uniref:tyrosine-type recombinase/integrase n=1 Tax=Lysobacter sp. MMG2 TaxID=2801338 RepID=UPI0031F2F36B
MAIATGKLTQVSIKGAKPGSRPVRMFDGGGLYLEVMPDGRRYWRHKYRFAGKEKRISHGVFPEVSLAEARARRDEARKVLASGIDPSQKRKAQKLHAEVAHANTFEAVATEWLNLQKRKWSAATYDKAKWALEAHIFKHLGSRPIDLIEPSELLAVLRRIEDSGKHETAHRTRAKCGQVFRYAIATNRAKRDPSADLRGALAPLVSRSYSAVTRPADIGDLLRTLHGYEGLYSTCSALRMAPYVFVRPGELRKAEWSEFNLDAAEWRIPGSKTKMRRDHIVPLSKQVVEILQELEPLTAKGRYLFPSVRSPKEPMSENTINAALRRLGYDKETMTGHGFRAMASTVLNEMGWSSDVIERQLAHAERNKVRAVYNRAEYLSERKQMMQAWADHLDQLRAGETKVVPIRGRRA